MNDDDFPWDTVVAGIFGLGVGALIGRASEGIAVKPAGAANVVGSAVASTTSMNGVQLAVKPIGKYQVHIPILTQAQMDTPSPTPINPFRLVEIATQSKPDWASMSDPLAYVEQHLGVGRQDLLSSSRSSILFSGPSAVASVSARLRPQSSAINLENIRSVSPISVAAQNPVQKWLTSRGLTCGQWAAMRETDKDYYYQQTLRAAQPPPPAILSIGGQGTVNGGTQSGVAPITPPTPPVPGQQQLKSQPNTKNKTPPSGQSGGQSSYGTTATSPPAQTGNAVITGTTGGTGGTVTTPSSTVGILGSSNTGAPFFGLPNYMPSFLNAIDVYCTGASQIGNWSILPTDVNGDLLALGMTGAQWGMMYGPDRLKKLHDSIIDYLHRTNTQSTSEETFLLMFNVAKYLDESFAGCVQNNNVSLATAQYAPISTGDISVKDVIQGCEPDCYFCASLAAVAWTRPDIIRNQLGVSSGNTVSIRLYTDDPMLGRAASSGGQNVFTVDIRIPCGYMRLTIGSVGLGYVPTGLGGLDQLAEWPSLFEKAKWGWEAQQTNVPACINLDAGLSQQWYAGGRNSKNDVAQISGGNGFIVVHANQNPWDLLVSHCDWFGKLTIPVVASTWVDPFYGVSQVLNGCSEVQLVLGHVYSVLGTIQENNQQYVVLRNPWGNTTPAAGTHVIVDGRSWNGLNLGAGGVFALRGDAFGALYDSCYGATF